MTSTLRLMQQTLSRMGEKCDPYVYYHRIRRFMSGWRDNQQLPNGLVYEGVASEPQLFYGETGAQSSIIPAFDAALGVMHPSGWLSDYLQVCSMNPWSSLIRLSFPLRCLGRLRDCFVGFIARVETPQNNIYNSIITGKIQCLGSLQNLKHG